MKCLMRQGALCLLVAGLLSGVALNLNAAERRRDDQPPTVDAQRMSDLVEELADAEYEGRLPGTAGDSRSRDVIVKEFQDIGLLAAVKDGYLQRFYTTISQPDGESHGNPANPLLGKRMATSNVIGILPGNDPMLAREVIIVSAHRDHLGRTPGGDHYPGANDDLSGLAATLELARMFAHYKGSNKRTLMFVAYGAEEQGEMGSMHHVAHPLPGFPNKNIVLMISIDMIGRGFERWSSYSQAQRDRYAETWFKQAYNGVNDDDDEYSHEYPPENEDSFSYDAGPFGKIGISNRVFGKAEGIPDYHKTTDTWDKVEFAPAAVFTRTVFDFLRKVDQDPRPHARP